MEIIQHINSTLTGLAFLAGALAAVFSASNFESKPKLRDRTNLTAAAIAVLAAIGWLAEGIPALF